MLVKAKMNEIVVNRFDENAANDFRTKLREFSEADSEKPIFINIDSYGGQVDALNRMLDAMDVTPNHLVTYCTGKAMSCGAVLLSHGDTRYLGRHSRVMIHQVSGVAVGDNSELKNSVKEVDALNTQLLGLLARNCGLRGAKDLKAILKANESGDLFLRGKAAVKFGIVDFLGQPSYYTQSSHVIAEAPLRILRKGAKGE